MKIIPLTFIYSTENKRDVYRATGTAGAYRIEATDAEGWYVYYPDCDDCDYRKTIHLAQIACQAHHYKATEHALEFINTNSEKFIE